MLLGSAAVLSAGAPAHLPALGGWSSGGDAEEFNVSDAGGGDGDVLSCSFLEAAEGSSHALRGQQVRRGARASHLTVPASGLNYYVVQALAVRFGVEVCRTGHFHDIQEAVGESTVEALLDKSTMQGFIGTLLGGIVTVITTPVSEIVIKGIIGTVMQLIAPFFVQAILIVACAIIPGPVSDQISGTLGSTVGSMVPGILVMIISGVAIARVMSEITQYIRDVVIAYLENEAVPTMAGQVTHMLTHTLTASISNTLAKELTHTLTHTLTHSLTHSVIHYYYCTYCYYYGDYCQYCFYYRDYSWLHRMTWTGSALMPNAVGDAPNAQPIKMRKLYQHHAAGGDMVTRSQQLDRDGQTPGAHGAAAGGPAPAAEPEMQVFRTTRGSTEAELLPRALAVMTGAYQSNELACQGLRHLFGVRDEGASPEWRHARMLMRDVNARVRLFVLRFNSWEWKPAWKEFAWRTDLCADDKVRAVRDPRPAPHWRLARADARQPQLLRCARSPSQPDQPSSTASPPRPRAIRPHPSVPRAARSATATSSRACTPRGRR
jgi:hypothetical protein